MSPATRAAQRASARSRTSCSSIDWPSEKRGSSAGAISLGPLYPELTGRVSSRQASSLELVTDVVLPDRVVADRGGRDERQAEGSCGQVLAVVRHGIVRAPHDSLAQQLVDHPRIVPSRAPVPVVERGVSCSLRPPSAPSREGFR